MDERKPSRNNMRENEGGASVMHEGRCLQAFQLEAHHKGSEIKQAHTRTHCVLQGVELLALAGDYAHLLLFKEQQRSREMADLHERAGLRMQAFKQGYEGELPGSTQERSGMAVRVARRRPKRRAKNRLARSQSI